MVLFVAARLRRLGIDLNWVFDPLGAMRFAVRRAVDPGRPGGAEKSRHEG